MNTKKEPKTPPKKCCKICEAAESKYKCPSCLIPYCSIVCCKKHKGTNIPPFDINRPCYIDVAEDVLPLPKLEFIASSTEIRDALKDKEIQKLISNIDRSADPGTELDKAMEQDVFRLFTEKILLTVNRSSDQ